MDKFKFWTKWLQITCIVFAIFGIVLAVFSQTPFVDFLLNNQVNPVFFGASSSHWRHSVFSNGAMLSLVQGVSSQEC